jgi:uncharacterized protein YdhG (YjbR/CyaY superfamily)
MKRSKEVDTYISDAGKEARPILRKLRSLFSITVPEAEEKISWDVPFYWWHGPLGGYAVYSKHVTFGAVAQTSQHIYGISWSGWAIKQGRRLYK